MARFELLLLFLYIYIILRRARGRQLMHVMCAMRSSSTETTQDSNTAMLLGATAHRSAQQRYKSHCCYRQVERTQYVPCVCVCVCGWVGVNVV